MSYCECEFDYIINSSNIKTVKAAKKIHACTECGYAICQGESYEHAVSFGGDKGINVIKTCSRCLAVLSYVQAHIPCFCRTWGNQYGQLDDGESSVDQAIRDYQDEVPGMGMEYGRIRIKVRQAMTVKQARIEHYNRSTN